MRIWILEIGEPLPLETGVRLHRYGQFSQFLAQAGHEVTWWTSSFSHAPKKHLVQEDTVHRHNGVTMQILKGPGYARNISFARIQHQKHFAQRFTELASRQPKPDLILAPIPTIDGAYAAVQWAKRNSVPCMIDIRDLWPDEIADLAPGPLRPLARLALRASYKKMQWTCQTATGIIGISPKYLNYGLKFAGRERSPLDVQFPLGYSADVKSSLNTAPPQVAALPLKPDGFNVVFFGTIGRFFDLGTVIEAARQLSRETPDVHFVLAGDGSDRARFEAQAQGLANVSFPGWLKQDEIFWLMKLSHAGLAPYKAGAKMEMPNKPFEYMAGSLPLISSLHGELCDLIEQQKIGVNYVADSVDSLKSAILRLRADRAAAREMGQKAHALLQERFATEVVFKRAEEHLRTCFAPPVSGRTKIDNATV